MKKLNQTRREKLLAWLFLSPATLAFVIFMFWPLAYTMCLSFLKWNMVAPVKTMAGVKNYLGASRWCFRTMPFFPT